MNSMIIIDDEAFFLNSIKTLLDWELFDISLKGAFTNPVEAMDYIKEKHVDIIMTDIKMPVVNGIDIAHYCHYNSPDTKVIFLSGYEDFEYAKQAINYSVYSYLTKPVSRSTLTKLFSELNNELGKNRIKNQFLSDGANDIIRKQFMRIMSEENADVQEIADSLNEFGIEFDYNQSHFAIISIKISDPDDYYKTKWHHNDEQLIKALENIINSHHYCGYSGLTFFYNSGFDIFFISKPNINFGEVSQFIDNLVVQLHDLFRECLRMNTEAPDVFIAKNADDLKSYNNTFLSLKKENMTKNKNQIMLDAKEYIDNHYSENITLGMISSKFGFNQTYFSNQFTKNFNVKFSDYLTKIRMEAAKELLVNSETKISSIPQLVGLSSLPTFSLSFKKYTGYSPSEYKDKFRKI